MRIILGVRAIANYNRFAIVGYYKDLDYLLDAFMYFLYDGFDIAKINVCWINIIIRIC